MTEKKQERKVERWGEAKKKMVERLDALVSTSSLSGFEEEIIFLIKGWLIGLFCVCKRRREREEGKEKKGKRRREREEKKGFILFIFFFILYLFVGKERKRRKGRERGGKNLIF